MAQKTVVLLEDDLDGGAADETVTFALDGVTYEIDLRADNAARLRDLFAPYAGAGRRVGRQAGPARPSAPESRPRAGSPTRADPAQLAAIRAWARARGIEVSDRGRIPAHIVEQYSNPTTAPPPRPAPPVAAAPPPQPPPTAPVPAVSPEATPIPAVSPETPPAPEASTRVMPAPAPALTFSAPEPPQPVRHARRR